MKAKISRFTSSRLSTRVLLENKHLTRNPARKALSLSSHLDLLALQRSAGNRAVSELLRLSTHDAAAAGVGSQKSCACSASGEKCNECEHEAQQPQHGGTSLPMDIAHALDHHSSGHGSKATRSQQEPIHRKLIAGLDVDKSHCSCLAKVPEKIKWAQFMAQLYGDCGKDSKMKSGADVEACTDAALAKKGITTSVAGTTDTTGAVKVKKSPGACGPVWDRGTEVHEAVHKGYQQALEKAHGKKTPAFTAHWDNPKEWAQDEVNAYSAEIPFYQAVAAHLQSICGDGGFSGTGALIGGGIGALGGAALGFLAGGAIGALIGGLIGGVGGLLVGGFAH